MVIPLALVLTGTLFLLRNLGLLPSPAWEVVWPLVLIILGAAAFFQAGDAKRELGWPLWDESSAKKTKRK